MEEYRNDFEVIEYAVYCPLRFFLDCLTVGAVPAAAGIAMVFQAAAVRTLGNVVAESSGFTVEDGTRCFLLDIETGEEKGIDRSFRGKLFWEKPSFWLVIFEPVIRKDV